MSPGLDGARAPMLRGRGEEECALLRLLDHARAGRGGALLLESGTGADGLALPAAVLGLLSAVAADQPVLACVDDVDRLDAASRDVLAFVARRVAGEPIALLFAARDGERGPEGLAVRVLGGLDETAVRERAGDLAPERPADDLLAALDRIARGNPLALGELIASLTADQLTGLAAPPTTLPRTGRLWREHEARPG